jgi:hypothetical protein
VNTLWLSETVAMYTGTVLVSALCAFWLVWDGILLRRHLFRRQGSHDQVFGSIIGLVIATIGIIGVIRFHLHWSG